MIDVKAFAPTADLAPFIRQHYLIRAGLPDEFVVADRLFADNAFVRVVLSGRFEAADQAGVPGRLDGAWLLGTNLHGYHVRITGPFLVAAFAIRPCAWRALFTHDAHQLVDRAVPLADDWGAVSTAMAEDLASASDDNAMVAAMEKAIRAQLAVIGRNRIDEQIALFEHMARTNSLARVDDIAARLGLSPRQFERRSQASFGLSPKVILRRSRFLDIAAAMKGYGTQGDKELAMLGYFDQSHRNREFRNFIGMTPGQFMKADAPLMAINLSLREQGKAMV
ncbi:MAG: hypothetical protein RL367_1234 [Pseudomonadota bacterium]